MLQVHRRVLKHCTSLKVTLARISSHQWTTRTIEDRQWRRRWQWDVKLEGDSEDSFQVSESSVSGLRFAAASSIFRCRAENDAMRGFAGVSLPLSLSLLASSAGVASSFAGSAVAIARPRTDVRRSVSAGPGSLRLSSPEDIETVALDTAGGDGGTSVAIEELMRRHDPILLFASNLLPRDVARDASALYAWCRRLDEIADDPSSSPEAVAQALSEWEGRFDDLLAGRPADEMDAELMRCLGRNRDMSEAPFRDMIRGMMADAAPGGATRTVATMDELEEYSYQVAGTVGLMLLPLLSAPPESRAPAIALGKAIQLINILRDARPDAALNRVYLPEDMLREAGVSVGDVLRLEPSGAYRDVVRRVSGRAEGLLREAEDGRSTLPGLGPVFVQIIVELYREYLLQLRDASYDNLSGSTGDRVSISFPQKVKAVLRALLVAR